MLQSATTRDSATSMASLDRSLTVTAATHDFFRQFARTSTDTCGRSIYHLLHPSAHTLLLRHFTQLSEGRRGRFVERVIARRGTDTVFSTWMTGIAVRGGDAEPSGFVLWSSPEDASEVDDVVFPPEPLLTPLAARILEGIATGSSTQQLAVRLYLSRQGVEYHVGVMLRLLKAPNRAALVSRAYAMGILTMGTWPPKAVQEFVK